MTKKSNEKARNKILVIVESPAKARTINKYLGKEYNVIASMGHIIDLPKSRMAINVDKDFEPDYITVRGRGKILDEIRKQANQSKEVLLASDDDREGEAISWHLQNALRKANPDLPIKRIVFNEVTKRAITESLKSPSEINTFKVNAQKARRVLDRLVGYSISPILWEKIKKGLSAGRVQSVALKLICQREEEIVTFVPREYWTIDGFFKEKSKKPIKTQLVKIDDQKMNLPNEVEVNKIVEHCNKQKFIVHNITQKERKKNPLPPFTTSKMQQDAANKLNFTSDTTMRIAQILYEGIDIGEETIGLISYMRTDSTRISEDALTELRNYIKSELGDKYLPETANVYKNKRNIQDAHEGIRPTSVYRDPKSIKQYLSPEQFKLYNLIWERFVSSQMLPAVYDNVQIEFKGGRTIFRISISNLVFDGFLKIYSSSEVETISDDDDVLQAISVPHLKKGDVVELLELKPLQHFTEPPARYTDATIVKKLEESGIGRPSTYAPIITTILKRYYVHRKQKQLIPTELGKITNKLLVDSFPAIINVDFTAKMEEDLDKVEEDQINWVNILRNFYGDFINQVKLAKEHVATMKNILDEETNEICEKCGSKMLKKLGRYGFFIACSAFPKCKNTKPIPLGDCPKEDCDGKIIALKTKKGRKKTFYKCTREGCDFTSWTNPFEKDEKNEEKKEAIAAKK